ncbi:hypothetical protein OU798_17560 [Prolixibacteraceae bacterium Z1-6]|uniref:Uncharacterized protein n=1 Tax=Draconibacterium aestuarii TaxID=2998507 RepID=A0A9X3FFG8_9BACT|nr:hypothetical protein [Prolixibacteraceae bacterium Z1-6]
MNPDHPKGLSKNYIPLFIFATTMGCLEAIVVVYVRELYYPDGFCFPLKILPQWLIGIEIVREFSTLAMLGAVAWISGKIFLKRLSVFLFIFGIWDIMYYLALKIFLNWPESLLTWDILFMIPITWIGPVLAPVICSALMIIMSLLFDYFQNRENIKQLRASEYFLLFGGAAIIYFTFTFDFGMILVKGNFLPHFFSMPNHPGFQEIMSTFTPTRFNWEIFTIGILLNCFGMILFVRRALKTKTDYDTTSN